MPSTSNFWLTLHQLAHELRKEGDSDDERTSGLIPSLESMQPDALATHLENLTTVTGSLNHLLARCKVR